MESNACGTDEPGEVMIVELDVAHSLNIVGAHISIRPLRYGTYALDYPLGIVGS